MKKNNKKNLSLLLLLFCLLVGCSNQTKNISVPYSVAVGNNIINYSDKKSDINVKYDGLQISLKEFTVKDWQNSENDDFVIFYNKDDIIRAFVINNEIITTMGGIHVGDNISKVKELFEYEQIINNNYCEVLFDGTTETNDYKNAQDNWLCIIYETDDDGTITTIMIYDDKFRREFR